MATQKDFIKTYRHYLSDKADRVATAVYLVTSILEDKEPLKWRLRDSVLEALDCAHQGKTEHVARALEHVSQAVELGRTSALISPMNADLMLKAIQEFSENIQSHSFFSDEYFSFFNTHASPQLEPYTKDEGVAPVAEQSREPAQPQTPARSHTPTRTAKKTKSNKGQKIKKTKSSARKERRRMQILEVMSDTQAQTIREISKKVKGFSEKTLQRELNTLIDKGHVEKHGARRWSKYVKSNI